MLAAVHKEVLSGTDSVEISCQVIGLTAALQTVRWENSDDTDVTNGVPGYTSEAGTFGGDSQTTTLIVAGSQNNADSVYKCLVRLGTQDGSTELSSSVHLNVFSRLIS